MTWVQKSNPLGIVQMIKIQPCVQIHKPESVLENEKINSLDTNTSPRFGFGFFVKWHINSHGLFNTKAILVEKQ